MSAKLDHQRTHKHLKRCSHHVPFPRNKLLPVFPTVSTKPGWGTTNGPYGFVTTFLSITFPEEQSTFGFFKSVDWNWKRTASVRWPHSHLGWQNLSIALRSCRQRSIVVDNCRWLSLVDCRQQWWCTTDGGAPRGGIGKRRIALRVGSGVGDLKTCIDHVNCDCHATSPSWGLFSDWLHEKATSPKIP